MEERLRRVAASLDGVFCSGDAHRIGIDDQAVDRLVRAGEVVRVRRGSFVVSDALRRTTPEQRFALKVRAILRARGPEVAASHHAALALHEVPLHGVDLEHVDLVADVERTRSKAGVSTHPVRSSHVVDVRGCRVVELPAALCQVAAASGTAAAVVGMDAALHRRACTRPDLERAAASSATPDAASVLVAVAATDSASESVGESLARLLLVDLGFAVRSQVPLSRGGSVVARVDFLVDGLVVVEFDGAVKYAGADGRDALVAEKRRESELVDLGYEVVRLTWADLERPEVVLAKVRAALRRASMRRTA